MTLISNSFTWSESSSLLLSIGPSRDSAVCSSSLWLLLTASFIEETCSWCHLSCSLRCWISSSSLSRSPSAASFSWTLELSLAWRSALCFRSDTRSSLQDGDDVQFTYKPQRWRPVLEMQILQLLQLWTHFNLSALCVAWRLPSSAVRRSVWFCSWSTWSLFSFRSSWVLLLSLKRSSSLCSRLWARSIWANWKSANTYVNKFVYCCHFIY